MSSRNEPERQAPHPPQDPAALAAVVEPAAPNQDIRVDPSQVQEVFILSFLFFMRRSPGSSTCLAFRLLFSLVRFSCTVGAFFCLFSYYRLHSALMFFIRLCAMRFLQIYVVLAFFVCPVQFCFCVH